MQEVYWTVWSNSALLNIGWEFENLVPLKEKKITNYSFQRVLSSAYLETAETISVNLNTVFFTTVLYTVFHKIR